MSVTSRWPSYKKLKYHEKFHVIYIYIKFRICHYTDKGCSSKSDYSKYLFFPPFGTQNRKVSRDKMYL